MDFFHVSTCTKTVFRKLNNSYKLKGFRARSLFVKNISSAKTDFFFFYNTVSSTSGAMLLRKAGKYPSVDVYRSNELYEMFTPQFSMYTRAG